MIGLVGSGNMARALARGWGEPVLCTDAIPERAEELAAETGGEALAGNGELADRADFIVLCHKPAQLGQVAEQVGGRARGVVSILGSTPLRDVRAAYGDTPVVRMLPSTPVEVAAGVTCHARDPHADPDFEARVRATFERVGPVVTVEESQIDAAMGLMSNAPAYWAVVVEAQVDAGIKAGVPADVAAELVVGTMAGTAELLRARGHDTLIVRRQVMSPGGSTARGLAALEAGGVRRAFDDAMQAVVRG
ncbi:MAG TPA: pyrroline-5-carboxylate reductase [Solirubrobacteraceae bacterium]|jgi:pyrroline-5-carboxylate reductase|nr:pyrroline-5-carboxylate reductase [Solirubrobacteraceae bacterium]